MSEPTKPHVHTTTKDGGRFVITKSRHIAGEYVDASPQFPVVLELSPGEKVDSGMTPESVFRARHNVALKPHYVVKRSVFAPVLPEEKPASGTKVVGAVDLSSLPGDAPATPFTKSKAKGEQAPG